MIAGERAAGPVGAAQAGRQPDDQKSRLRVAEGADRGVVPGRKGLAVGRPEPGQTRAQGAMGRGRRARAAPITPRRVAGCAGNQAFWK
jgi:hypothetical protein